MGSDSQSDVLHREGEEQMDRTSMLPGFNFDRWIHAVDCFVGKR
jgi:hypothetical protein